MHHVNAIAKMIDDGSIDEAESALDNLLELGPGNVEALKLKARLYSYEGRFLKEEETWHRVLELVNDDIDAIEFLHQRQIDYYFTDDLPGGLRRFLAYPRALIRISIIGLLGCIAFLIVTRMAEQQQWGLAPEAVFLLFGALVISPWLGIVFTWCRSLKSVTVSHSGIKIAARFATFDWKWTDIAGLHLVHHITADKTDLSLVILPQDSSLPGIDIDLGEDTSSIRARSFLVNEIGIHTDQLAHGPRDQIRLDQRQMRYY